MEVPDCPQGSGVVRTLEGEEGAKQMGARACHPEEGAPGHPQVEMAQPTEALDYLPEGAGVGQLREVEMARRTEVRDCRRDDVAGRTPPVEAQAKQMVVPVFLPEGGMCQRCDRSISAV